MAAWLNAVEHHHRLGPQDDAGPTGTHLRVLSPRFSPYSVTAVGAGLPDNQANRSQRGLITNEAVTRFRAPGMRSFMEGGASSLEGSESRWRSNGITLLPYTYTATCSPLIVHPAPSPVLHQQPTAPSPIGLTIEDVRVEIRKCLQEYRFTGGSSATGRRGARGQTADRAKVGKAS